jgi:hypothetical protein
MGTAVKSVYPEAQVIHACRKHYQMNDPPTGVTKISPCPETLPKLASYPLPIELTVKIVYLRVETHLL